MGDPGSALTIPGGGIERKCIVVVVPEVNSVMVRRMHGARSNYFLQEPVDSLSLGFGHPTIVLPHLHTVESLRFNVIRECLEDLTVGICIVFISDQLCGLVLFVVVLNCADIHLLATCKALFHCGCLCGKLRRSLLVLHVRPG